MKITTLFFDIGGVTLTNGWDHNSRIKAAEHFLINYDEFNGRHKKVFKSFEKGKVTLNDYLEKVIFFKKRNFSREDFIIFMKNQSKPYSSTLKILKKLSDEKKYFLAAINNESFELNNFRIKKFKLNKYFKAFFSSSYLHERKPETEIFNIALNVLQKKASGCLFIDDRKENIIGAKKVGLQTIHLKETEQLKKILLNKGIKI